jgi:glutamate---cysteine ligase / carboxylate-amine ligase
VAPEAQRFSCTTEIARAREILVRGTSAHRQTAVYAEAVARGGTKQDALFAVVDWLIAETVAGL